MRNKFSKLFLLVRNKLTEAFLRLDRWLVKSLCLLSEQESNEVLFLIRAPMESPDKKGLEAKRARKENRVHRVSEVERAIAVRKASKEFPA